MMTPYGSFSRDGKEFRINTPDLPRNWYNYFHTDHYITFTSQAGIGQGFLQDTMGRRLTVVEQRGLYLMTGDEGWSLCGLPVYAPRDAYSCTHGLGYTLITLEKKGLRSEYLSFVPADDHPAEGMEVHAVRVTNLSRETRRLLVLSYFENAFDGTYRYQAYNTDALHYDGRINGLHYGMNRVWDGRKRHFEAFSVCSPAPAGYECTRNAFIGPYGSIADPAVLHHGGCKNGACVAEKMGFGLQTEMVLAPGESGFCTFLAGITDTVEDIRGLSSRFDTEEKTLAELAAVRDKYNRLCEPLRFNTPDEPLNHLLNHWLKYQTDMGSRWARVRHNGYRDIASDTECLSVFRPALAWERLKRIMTYQYANGYAPRTFLDGEIRDNNFADCTVWLTFTAYAAFCELGQKELLLEEVPFNDGSSATVFEHLRRSLDFLYGFRGLHGLIRIWGGDWNDCMNTAGLKGKGVSVWLSIAWYRANRQFISLCRVLGMEDEAALQQQRGQEMKELVNRYGWSESGRYYLYAYDDDDHPIGDPSCEEGKVFLNPQLWAVLSGISDGNRASDALKQAEKLLDCPLGTRVSTPPYTERSASIGSIAEKAPGVQENGGVYLHAMCWKLAADAILGREDRVAQDITCILPFRNPVVQGRAEPYTLCNCYMGEETGYRYGTPGQSWRTASGQWFLKAMENYVFGLLPCPEGLQLLPCLPAEWQTADIVKPFRGGTYHIHYRRTGKAEIRVQGKKLQGCLLPPAEAATEVEVDLP